MNHDWIFPVLEWRVVDGDTVRVKLDLGWGMNISQYCRVVDVDTPEKSTKAGKAVTKCVESWMQSGVRLRCQSVDRGKFRGRFVGDIRSSCDERLSEFILKAKLCRLYSGGTRHPWTDDELIQVEERAEECLNVQ